MTTFAGHLLTGLVSARPGAGTVPEGTLYAATDEGIIYQSDGASWSEWSSAAGSTTKVVTTVRNESGGVLSAGTPVYISGFNVGQDIIEVDAADASTEATLPAIGLVAEDIANSSNGTVVLLGNVDNVDTSAYTSGDKLYVSETAGELTDTPPSGAALNQLMGEVLRSNATTGQIEVTPGLISNSGFMATLLDDGDAATARATLGAKGDVEYADTVDALTYAATVTPDPADGMWFTITLTGNVTFDLTNMTAGQTIVIDITQDGTGSRTVGFTQTVEWPGGTAFTATTTANARDRIVIDYDGSTYTGNVVGQDYS